MGRSHDDIAEHFDARAPDYASRAGWINDSVSLAPIVTFSSARPGGLLLEIGAGTGAVSQAIAASSADVRSYVSVDLSLAMARASLQHGPALVGDGHHLPIASGRIDAVVCRQSFHYLRDADVALAEVTRVLVPGGRLLIAQIVPFDTQEDQAWWSNSMEIRQPLRKHLWTAASLRTALERCGLVVTQFGELRRRTSLAGWVERYPLEPAAHAALIEHFASTPTGVRRMRAFDEHDGDIEYDLRWVFLTAHPARAAS